MPIYHAAARREATMRNRTFGRGALALALVVFISLFGNAAAAQE